MDTTHTERDTLDTHGPGGGRSPLASPTAPLICLFKLPVPPLLRLPPRGAVGSQPQRLSRYPWATMGVREWYAASLCDIVCAPKALPAQMQSRGSWHVALHLIFKRWGVGERRGGCRGVTARRVRKWVGGLRPAPSPHTLQQPVRTMLRGGTHGVQRIPG